MMAHQPAHTQVSPETNNTAKTRTALRKYAQGKSVQIQGAVRNLTGTMLRLEKHPTDTVLLERLKINHNAFKALSSEEREI